MLGGDEGVGRPKRVAGGGFPKVVSRLGIGVEASRGVGAVRAERVAELVVALGGGRVYERVGIGQV